MGIARKILLVAALLGSVLLVPSAFAQCRDIKCLAGASASASGDLLALFGSPDAEMLQMDNVSALVGQRVVGPVTRWQAPDGESTVEHLAGVNPDGDLLVFFWSLRTNWQVVNVSSITGQRVVGPVITWQTQDGSFTVDHLAGVSPDGRLLVFFWSPRADWQAVDLSAITGQRLTNVAAAIATLPARALEAGQQVIGPLTSWRTQEGPSTVEHLAGLNLDGDLVVFFWSPQADWQVVNVSAITGQRVAGPVTSWQVQEGPLNFQNLAGVTSNGDLLVFFRSPLSDWRAVNVSGITKKQVAGPVTSWVKGGVEHLSAAGLNENGIYVFWSAGTGRQTLPGWAFCDVAQTACTPTLFAVRPRRGNPPPINQ
jgi:hypothetical protein